MQIKNLDTFETVRKMGENLKKKIQTVLKPSRKLAIIWEKPDSFETIQKTGNHLKKARQFLNCPENLQTSG